MSFDANEGAWVILGINLVVSLLGLYVFPDIIRQSLFRPYWVVREKQYSSIVMSGFVHTNLTHLLLNMVTFYFFAFPLERVLGTTKFVLLYAIGLLGGQLGTWFMQRKNPKYASLGASGAISAVLLAYIVYFPTHSLYFLLIPVPIPAFVVAIAFLVYSWIASGRKASVINHHAHLYGALSGLVYLSLIDPGAYKNLLELF
ncbi:MAG: rhomboid family intramembrane serine protease [Gammaproteobacteria bacterium]|nr:MAG: rhomboid family intramembrane serine protease [Gammaproteobacteria bacterium]RLA53774.1 MAG: rhomboid family intramembrane serine protease [Gammaproteobacteria bacterium]